MTTLNAKDVIFKFEGKVLGCVKSLGFKVSQETDEATCAGSNGWKEFTLGFQSWTASVNSVYRQFTAAELATEVAFDDVLDVILDGTQMVEIEFSKRAGGTRYKGNAILSEVSFDQPEKGAVTWSASLTGSGAFVKVV